MRNQILVSAQLFLWEIKMENINTNTRQMLFILSKYYLYKFYL